jgi:type I restriction enzyme S subunit
MRDMKDSGIDWIGEIPNNWNIGRVKNIYSSKKEVVGEKSDEFERLSLTLNGVLKRSKESNDGLQPEEFKGYQVLYENELVFKLIDLENIKTSRVGLSPYTGIVSPAYITLNNPLHAKYGYYFFLSLWHRNIFNALTGDGVRGNLSAKDLLNMEYPLLQIEEQDKIATYLGQKVVYINDIIEKTKESIEEYKKLKQSIITEAVTRGLNHNVKMKDSGVFWLPQIPNNWNIIKIKNLCKLKSGENLTSEDIANEGSFPVYGGNGIRGYYDKYNQSGEFLLIGRQGALCGNIQYVNTKFWATEHALVVSDFGSTNIRYLYYLFITMNLNQYSQASAQPGLSANVLINLSTCVPPLKEQEEIGDFLVKKIAEIEKFVLQKNNLLLELESYRKSLIYEVVTGKKEIDGKEVN